MSLGTWEADESKKLIEPVLADEKTRMDYN